MTTLSKKVYCFLFFVFFTFTLAPASDWILGAEAFSFTQQKNRSESEIQSASVLPQLILEQIASDEVRLLPDDEILDRKLHELQTERLSLFLQLSKENKERDSLILTESNQKKLGKLISAKIKKIKEIEDKIDENIKQTSEEIKRYEKKSAVKNTPEKDGKKPFFPFPVIRKNGKDGENELSFENVVLFNNDSSSLFSPSKNALEDGFGSWNFEQEVIKSGINGLITGAVTSYGEYCSVSVELRVFPGGKSLGSVTEVGTLSDLMPLANRISQNLSAKIANSLPVIVEFLVKPDEAFEKAVITIDGVVQTFEKNSDFGGENSKIISSGIHRITIESEGYEPLSISYSFTGDGRFKVFAGMKEKKDGVVNIRLKKYSDGIFYAGGTEAEKISPEKPFAALSVNGKNVLGVFSTDDLTLVSDGDNDGNIAFFRIPEKNAFDGAYLFVNAKPYNREKNIDKARRRMYLAYSVFVCSLPAAFYCYGNYLSEHNAYTLSFTSFDSVSTWKNRTYISAGISSALGAWAIFELVRYLWAADKVLPANAKIDKNGIIKMKTPESVVDEYNAGNDESKKIVDDTTDNTLNEIDTKK